MKSSTLIALITTTLIALGIFLIFRNGDDLPVLTNYTGTIPPNAKIVILGDSLAQGYGSQEGGSLDKRIQELLELPVINMGVSGNTTKEVLRRIINVPDDTYFTVVIAGGNDVLRKVPPQETYKNMREIIESLQEQGSIVAIASVKSSIFGDGPLSEQYEIIAQESGSLYLGNILKDVFGNQQYMFDAIHPNSAGYEIIAQMIAAQIEPYVRAD